MGLSIPPHEFHQITFILVGCFKNCLGRVDDNSSVSGYYLCCLSVMGTQARPVLILTNCCFRCCINSTDKEDVWKLVMWPTLEAGSAQADEMQIRFGAELGALEPGPSSHLWNSVWPWTCFLTSLIFLTRKDKPPTSLRKWSDLERK